MKIVEHFVQRLEWSYPKVLIDLEMEKRKNNIIVYCKNKKML